MTTDSGATWPTTIHKAAEAVARVALRTDDPALLRRAAAMLEAIAWGVEEAEMEGQPLTERVVADASADKRGLYLQEDDGLFTLTDLSARRPLVEDASLDEVLACLGLNDPESED